jgi:uncharacterized protein (DUF697 family)
LKKGRLVKKAWNIFKKVKEESKREVKIVIYSQYPEVAEPLKELIGNGSPYVTVKKINDLNSSDLTIFFLIGEREELETLEKIIFSSQVRNYLVTFASGNGKIALFLKEKRVPLHLVHLLSSVKDYEDFLKAVAGKIPRGKLISAGRNLPSLRNFVAERVIREVALENGWLAAMGILPGADYPFLTLNQVRMALELAVIYGCDINGERLKEILSVAGGGLIARSLAREALSLLPIAGWLAKGGISYSGTLAMGKLLKEYFRRGKWQ